MNDLDIALITRVQELYHGMPCGAAWGQTLLQVSRLKPALARAFIRYMVKHRAGVARPDSVAVLESLGAVVEQREPESYKVVGYRGK